MSLKNTKKALVINYFLTEEDNSYDSISSLTGISVNRVEDIVTNYLNNIEVDES